jgi:hypothetical protein
VYPILTYSAEIWEFENKNIIEKIHLKFRKKILGVKTSTPNFMVYGEPATTKTGRHDIAEILLRGFKHQNSNSNSMVCLHCHL